MTIEVGSFVIINEVDAPICKLVAQVTEVKPRSMPTGKIVYHVTARYITTYPGLKLCSANLERVTLVSDFGIELSIRNGLVCCEQKRESVAKYADGSTRYWQDINKIAQWPLRKALSHLEQLKGETK